MIVLDTYEFKDLNTGKITPKSLFTGAYVEEVFESDHICTTTNAV